MENIRYVLLIVGVLVLISAVKLIWQHCSDNRIRRPATVDEGPAAAPASDRTPSSGDSCFGPVNYYANARHGQKDRWFVFEYRKEGNRWLTYIDRMPSLNGRSSDGHSTHRYSRNDVYWICYDPQPGTLEEAQIISRAWADRELEYIATGTLFEDQRW